LAPLCEETKSFVNTYEKNIICSDHRNPNLQWICDLILGRSHCTEDLPCHIYNFISPLAACVGRADLIKSSDLFVKPISLVFGKLECIKLFYTSSQDVVWDCSKLLIGDHIDCLKYLIEMNPIPDAHDQGSWLSFALSGDAIECAKYLISQWSWTPSSRHYCTQYTFKGHRCIRFLLSSSRLCAQEPNDLMIFYTKRSAIRSGWFELFEEEEFNDLLDDVDRDVIKMYRDFITSGGGVIPQIKEKKRRRRRRRRNG
jgi:hypothetical protein